MNLTDIKSFILNDLFAVLVFVLFMGAIIKVFAKEKFDALKNAASKTDLDKLEKSITIETGNLRLDLNELKHMFVVQAQMIDRKFVDIYDTLISMKNK